MSTGKISLKSITSSESELISENIRNKICLNGLWTKIKCQHFGFKTIQCVSFLKFCIKLKSE